jgi:hypothetical protein
MRPLGLLPNPFEPYGIKFSLSYIGDLLANLDGGLRRGAVYEGRLNAAVDLDFAKLAGAAPRRSSPLRGGASRALLQELVTTGQVPCQPTQLPRKSLGNVARRGSFI